MRLLAGREVIPLQSGLCDFTADPLVAFSVPQDATVVTSYAKRRRYIEVNAYNRNLLTLVREAEKEGRIEIFHESAPGFGSNPLLSGSVLVWRPRLPTD